MSMGQVWVRTLTKKSVPYVQGLCMDEEWMRGVDMTVSVVGGSVVGCVDLEQVLW